MHPQFLHLFLVTICLHDCQPQWKVRRYARKRTQFLRYPFVSGCVCFMSWDSFDVIAFPSTYICSNHQVNRCGMSSRWAAARQWSSWCGKGRRRGQVRYPPAPQRVRYTAAAILSSPTRVVWCWLFQEVLDRYPPTIILQSLDTRLWRKERASR